MPEEMILANSRLAVARQNVRIEELLIERFGEDLWRGAELRRRKLEEAEAKRARDETAERLGW